MPRANSTAMIILIINVAFYLAEIAISSGSGHGLTLDNISGRAILLLGCKWMPLIAQGQWWRLITAGFLHGSILHIAINSYSLFILVTEVEQFYGVNRFIVAYIFSTFTGFAASSLFSPMTPSLGASAAAYGLIGIMLAMTVGRRTHPLVQLVRTQYTQWLIFGIVMSVWGSHIDLAAHIGGFLGGFLVGLVAGLPTLPGSPREQFWRVAAGVTIALTLYCFLQDFLFLRANVGVS